MNEKLRAAAQAAYRAMISAELSDGSRREWEAAVDGLKDALAEPAIKESLTVAGEKHMNPSDKYEQIKDIKRLNPVELEAMVLKHDQQIKDLAAHLREKNG